MLSMHAQYFNDVVDVDVKQAREIANLVEGSYDLAQSSHIRRPGPLSIRGYKQSLREKLQRRASKQAKRRTV